ncbi:ABC transporter substrate-binding protein [Helicobacter sp. 23-1044]
MIRKIARFCVLCVLVCGVIWGETPSKTQNKTHSKTPKDTIIIAVENQSERLNPLFSEDHDESLLLIFSGLIRFDENMRAQGDLAKFWEISKDGRIYDFYLREGVKWHDGAKFSAKDVAFTLQSLLDSALNSPLKANFEMIDKVQIINDFHIKITLKSPFAPFLDAMSVGIIPFHLLQNENLNTTKFNQNPIGTGAFKFQHWQKGQYIALSANENYHLGAVRTPKLIIRHISDLNMSAIELKNGSVDVSLVGFEMAKSFKNDARFRIIVQKSADYRALSYNFNNPILADLAVRNALNYAVDREMIAQKLLHSLGTPAYHPLQNSWVNPANFAKYEYNPKKAEQILQNGGWAKNKKGIFEKNGVELAFEMYAMSNDPLRVALVKLLSAEFAKIGIKTKIHAKHAGSFDYTKIDSFLVGWGSPFDPDLHTYRVFESSQKSVWNFGGYNNKGVDIALKNARNTQDSAIRKKYYADFISAIQGDSPFLFLVYLDFPLVFASNIKGIKPHILGHHGVGFAWNAWQWSKE